MQFYIYSYYVYICMGANILLLYMLYLSMYLYTEYSVYMYADICGYGVLIARCNYELIIKQRNEKQPYLEFKWEPKIRKKHFNM
jgi:hypothetical protein